jgi:hypothetical protein
VQESAESEDHHLAAKGQKGAAKVPIWSKIPEEFRPILHHCFATLLVLGCLLVVGAAVRLLRLILPEHDYGWIESCDLIIAMIVMGEFAAYSIAILSILLISDVMTTARRKFGVLSPLTASPEESTVSES